MKTEKGRSLQCGAKVPAEEGREGQCFQSRV